MSPILSPSFLKSRLSTLSTSFLKKTFPSFLSQNDDKKWERPLGRWSQCGDKKEVDNILELKIRQKQRRQYLLETGIDPYHTSIHPPLAHLDTTDDQYMFPYIVQH